MRSLTFSLGLVLFLALSNLTNAQFSSKEYLSAIGDLVDKEGVSKQIAISPLQSLFYFQFLPPNYLWGDLSTRILLGGENEYENARLFVNHFSKSFVDNLWWSDAEPINAPYKTVGQTLKESYRAEAVADIATVANRAPVSIKPLEKKILVPDARKSSTTNIASEMAISVVSTVPTDYKRIKDGNFIEYGSMGFYQGSAIIHPSYEGEMASLAAHMKTDLTLKLIIHGYCNSSTPSTIIAAGIMTEFFEVNSHDQRKTVTSKEFSELRAAYAKRYLISQGINPQRIQTIGEGATKRIYSETSRYAHYNDRIEFEITKY